MHPFNSYITGRSGSVDPEELDRLIARYEWFGTARRARAALTGKPDARIALPSVFWPTIPPERYAGTEAEPARSPAEDRIIERFLELGPYRIVPDEGPDGDISGAAADFDDDVLPTEELAEIYRSQGLYAEAEEIYRKLSLRNPEKSIYFADVIARMDSEKRQ